MPTRVGRGLVRDGLVYSVGLAMQRGLTVLVLPAATRILGPHDFGVASAALVVAGVLSSLFSLGLNFAVVRLYFDERPDAARTEWAMLIRAQLLLGGALAGVAWLLGPWWSQMYKDVPWSGALQAAVVLALALASQQTTLGVLRAARRIVAFVAVIVTQVALGAALGLLLADRYGAGGLVSGLAIGTAVSAVLGVITTYRRPVWSLPALRTALVLSLPFVAHMLSSWVISLSDRVLIERYLGLDDLAAYQVAYAVAIVPILLTDGMQAAWLPHWYELSDGVKRELPRRLLPLVTLAVGALAAVVVLFAPVAIRILAPQDFDVPVEVVALVVSATFVRASYLLAFAVVSDAKDTRSIARASFAGAIVNFVVNLWLIPIWGMSAAAATTLAAYALMSLIVLRRAEGLVRHALGLGPLIMLWTVITGAMLLLAALPTGAAGWTLRSLLALAAIGGGWSVTRRIRRHYVAATTGPAISL